MEAIVDQYFHASFKCKGIIALLERCHRKKASLRTLHQLLQQQNLYRKGVQSCTRHSFVHSAQTTG